jgi:prevent-host-death family protein
MKVVKIADAKNNLSRHLEYVKRGGRIRIVDRDVPVAELIPIAPESASSDDLLADMVRRGVARPPSETGPIPKDLLRPGRRRRGRGTVVEALIEERREGR